MKLYHPRNPEGGQIGHSDSFTQSNDSEETAISETVDSYREPWVKYLRQPRKVQNSTQTGTEREPIQGTTRPLIIRPEIIAETGNTTDNSVCVNPSRSIRHRRPPDRFGEWVSLLVSASSASDDRL